MFQARSKLLFSCAVLCLMTACSKSSLPEWMGGGEEKKPVVEGERIAVLAEGDTLVPDTSLAGVPVELPAPDMSLEWRQHHGNEAADAGHPALAEAIAVRAQAEIGEGEAFSHGFVSTPVVSNGVVYAMDALGTISAHKAGDVSTVLWRSKGVQNAEEESMLAGGLAYSESKLFAVSGNGLAAAFDGNSGRELWRQPINIPVRAAPTVAAGRVYIVTIDSQLFALDAQTGNILWNDRGIGEGASFLASASAAYADGLVAAPYASGEIKVLGADDGQQIWSDSLSLTRRDIATGMFSGMGGDPVILGNALYAVSASGVLGAYRLDNGLRVWEQPISSNNTLFVAGNAVYALTSNAALVCLNRLDGRIYWVSQLPRYGDEENRLDAFSWSGPVLAGGRLYIAGAEGELRVFSPEDGKPLPAVEIPDGVYGAPIVTAGRMYLVTKDAELVELY